MAAEIIWFEPVHRYKYPHMSPADVQIWERFLDTNPNWLKQVAYDVRVGEGQDPGDAYDQSTRDMAIKLTQLRIDVLNNAGYGYHIIEVKMDPGAGAVGQLLSYRSLFTVDYPELSPVFLTLLCNRITPDLTKVCTNYNIKPIVI